MTQHPSHPDQLMARALGVCWHSPTSDRWPCQEPLADWEIELLRPCGACGCTEASHGANEGDSGCRIGGCECDAFEPVERDSCACGQDPIECNHEAVLGEIEEKLRQATNLIAEFEARAEAAKYLSTTTEEDESFQMVEWGRHYGYAGAAKLLREVMS